MEKKKEFTIVVEKDEDNYYVGEVIELPGCHSQAKSMDELMKRMKEAISLYLEVKADIEMPSWKSSLYGTSRWKDYINIGS